MNPRTQFIIKVTALITVIGLLTFSQISQSEGRASAATWPLQPGVPFIDPAETGSISGHVFKADGVTVISDVLISVHASGVSTGTSSLGTYASQADGSYTISGLTPGTYKVQGNNNRVGSYTSEYYNNKLSWDQAYIITVGAGQTATGIDFALEPAGAISGHVFKADGITPVANACVNVSTSALQWNQVAGFCCTGSDGSFTITGVPVGRVYVQTYANCRGSHPNLQDEWYAEGGSTPDGNFATPVMVVAGQTTSDLNFSLDSVGSISGAIYNADGSSLISNVMYAIASAERPGDYTSWCTGNGQFSIPVRYGRYKLFAKGDSRNCGGDPNYAREYWRETTAWAEARIITLSPESPNTTGIVFTLERGASISGHVYESDGVTPVANACVNVSSTAPNWNQVDGTCCTGSDGSYMVAGLPVGRVYVRTHANCQNAHPDLSDEWYAVGGSTPDGSRATPVDVAAGQTTQGINFQLNRMSVVKGTIYNADGSQTIPHAGINYSPADNQGSYSSYCADDNGRFSISMPPGSYKFFARGDKGCGSNPNLAREYWRGTAVWNEAEVVTVPDATPVMREITFTLSLGGSIWGTVRDATSLSPIGGGLVVAYAPDGQVAAFVCAYDDGSYVIPGFLLGDYKVWAGGWCRANPNYVREYWQEKLTWETADIVTLSEGSRERREVNFTLLLGSRIAGMIYRSDGVTPITGTPVYVRLYNAATGAVQAETQTWQQDGSYAFSAFPPGTYRVKAWVPSDTAYFAEYYDGKPDEEAADILSLAADQMMAGIDFSLDRGAITEVPPATGATLVYTDTQDAPTVIQVPAAAVTETTTLVYTEVMTSTSPSGFVFAGHAFALTALQAGQPVADLTFNQPVTITLAYSDADVTGMDEATLELRYWDGSAWSTAGITVIERDPAHNRLVAAISHLSKFATFAEPLPRLYLPLIMRP